MYDPLDTPVSKREILPHLPQDVLALTRTSWHSLHLGNVILWEKKRWFACTRSHICSFMETCSGVCSPLWDSNQPLWGVGPPLVLTCQNTSRASLRPLSVSFRLLLSYHLPRYLSIDLPSLLQIWNGDTSIYNPTAVKPMSWWFEKSLTVYWESSVKLRFWAIDYWVVQLFPGGWGYRP